MDTLSAIATRAQQEFETRTAARDKALGHARLLTRHCALAIRAVHRGEDAPAREKLNEAGQIARTLANDLADYPDLYYAGYTQDALKEFAEASIVFALAHDGELPQPEELGLEFNTYLQGLAEAGTEMRRRCLDMLRLGRGEEALRLLGIMDEIFSVLVTMDFPDAVTGGLRRLTDVVRGVNERTRSDLTLSLRQKQLEEQIGALQKQLDGYSPPHASAPGHDPRL